jgi:hypothetical protein
VKYGLDLQLEEIAWALIQSTLTCSHHEKADILTPWKAYDRNRRRVLVAAGRDDLLSPSELHDTGPDKHVRCGMYHRAYNHARPDLNSVDNVANRPHRIPRSNWDCGYTFPARTPAQTITLGEWGRM